VHVDDDDDEVGLCSPLFRVRADDASAQEALTTLDFYGGGYSVVPGRSDPDVLMGFFEAIMFEEWCAHRRLKFA
jgi:hypothetical protein